MISYINIAKIGWRKWIRAKNSVLFIGMMSAALLVFQLGIWGHQIGSYFKQFSHDDLAQMTLDAMGIVAMTLVVGLTVVLITSSLLKLQDNLPFVRLLKAIGYNSGQVTLFQYVELGLTMVLSCVISTVVAVSLEIAVLAYINDQIMVLAFSPIDLVIRSTIRGYLAIGIAYSVAMVACYLWIGRIKPG